MAPYNKLDIQKRKQIPFTFIVLVDFRIIFF